LIRLRNILIRKEKQASGMASDIRATIWYFNMILKQLYKDMSNNPTNFAPYAVKLSAKLGPRVILMILVKWTKNGKR